MNKKGFTLTELLVVVVILGIIAGMAIPLIRSLSGTFTKKKYENYKDSVLSAAKLYVDSYDEDLFGHEEYGCATITYEQLVKRNLIKDIEVDGMSCNSQNTYVMVVKQGNKHVYAPYVSCGHEKNGSADDTTITVPNDAPTLDSVICNFGSNILIDADTSQSGNTYDKKRKTTKITLTSYSGIDNNISIYTKWSKDKNDQGSGFTKTTFKVPGDQEATLLSGQPIKSTSKELVTPENTEGQWYLIVRVDHLQDSHGHQWKNPDGSNSRYLSYGPFSVDNTPPTVVAEVYKCDSNYNKTGGLLKSKTITGGEDTLDLSDVSGNYNGWLNNANFYNGICFYFKLNDNVIVKSHTWKWNKDGQGPSVKPDVYKVLNGGSTPKEYSSGKSQTYNNFLAANGHRYSQLTVKDLAGNKTTINFDVKIDRNSPKVVVASQEMNSSFKPTSKSLGTKESTSSAEMLINGWQLYGANFNFTITDNMGITYKAWRWNRTGINSTSASDYKTFIDKAEYTDISSTLRETQSGSLTGEGYRYGGEIVRDIAGNETYLNVGVNVDRTKPTCGTASGSSQTWTNSPRTVNQYCSDAISGCKKNPYPKTYSTTQKTDTITISDNAGNTNTCTYDVYVDTTKPNKPTINNPKAGVWSNSSYTMTIKSHDDHSGIKDYQYRYAANSNCSTSNSWITESGATTSADSYDSVFSANGDHYACWRVCDKAGNCSDTTGTHVKIDTVAPECKVSYSNQYTTSGVHTSVSCWDETSGVSHCDSGDYYLTYDVWYSVTDYAGNTGWCLGDIESYYAYGDWQKVKIFENGGSYTCPSDYGDWDFNTQWVMIYQMYVMRVVLLVIINVLTIVLINVIGHVV